VIDLEVAEIEERMGASVTLEEVFAQEDQAANRYVLAELRGLRAELAKLLEAKHGT
jgi:hypothetical protein